MNTVTSNQTVIRQAAALYERRAMLQRYFGSQYQGRLDQAVTRVREHMATTKDDNPVTAAMDYCLTLNTTLEDGFEREDAKQFALVAAIDIAEGNT